MTNDTQELEEIIDLSFLQENIKQALKQQLKIEGASQDLLLRFNHLLTVELEKIGAIYEETMDGIESQQDLLNDEYEEKRRSLDDSLENKLKEISPTDLIAKEKLFNQYYQEVDLIQTNFEKNIKDLYSKFFASIIKRTS